MDHDIDAMLRQIADEVIKGDDRPMWLTVARRAFQAGRDQGQKDMMSVDDQIAADQVSR